MSDNFNFLRLTCLMQDGSGQNYKRVVLSIIYEILYDSKNEGILTDDLLVVYQKV